LVNKRQDIASHEVVKQLIELCDRFDKNTATEDQFVENYALSDKDPWEILGINLLVILYQATGVSTLQENLMTRVCALIELMHNVEV